MTIRGGNSHVGILAGHGSRKPARDLMGQRFGSVVVTRKAASLDRARWYARCDCGHERVYTSSQLNQRKSAAYCGACQRGVVK